MTADNRLPDDVIERAARAAWPEFRSCAEQEDWEYAEDGRKDRLRMIARAALLAARDAPQLTRLHFEDGKLDAAFATESAKYLAEAFRDLCDKHGAQNYLEMKMHDAEGREFIVTVQRGGHPSPHDLRRQAEQKLAALQADTARAGEDGNG
jgi:hypothetical protein